MNVRRFYNKKKNKTKTNSVDFYRNTVIGIFSCVPNLGKRRFSIKLWKTFTDCFNCLPIAAIIDEKIFCCHGGTVAYYYCTYRVELFCRVSGNVLYLLLGLSPDLQSMEQIRRIMRPTDVPDTGTCIFFSTARSLLVPFFISYLYFFWPLVVCIVVINFKMRNLQRNFLLGFFYLPLFFI